MAVDTEYLEKILAARQSHQNFMRHCWQRNTPFLVGRHTQAICSRIDQAMADYGENKSTYLAIQVPFRHGKSDIVSRYLPCHFLGEYPEDEVIVSGYSAGLVYKFSRFARSVMRSDKFRQLYGVRLSSEVANVAEWGLDNGLGKAQFMGLGGSITGSGGNLVILDDFYKNRQEAESEVIREGRWESFTNDLMTRLAPVCIVIVLATPWHVDDIFGRIKKHMRDDADFPRFEFIRYPAFGHEAGYDYETLFPERFATSWYLAQRATLGSYGAASLMQCDPQVRGGNMLKTENIRYIEGKDMPHGLLWVRAWDLASSEKQRQKDDPDFTSGPRLAVQWAKGKHGEMVPTRYVDDWVRGQWEAPARNQRIKDTAMVDGAAVQVGVEAFGGYKDAYTTLADVLKGIRSVRKLQLPGDKVAKASVLEPIFEAGNVVFKRAPWNEAVKKQLAEFPSGAHDDDVDALSAAYEMHNHKSQVHSGRYAI